MTKLLAQRWISAALGALVYCLATILFWHKPDLPPPQHLLRPDRMHGPSWNFNNPEADQLVTELKLERKAVQEREQQLDDLAMRLNTERSELGQVIQSVRELQTNFDKAVLNVNDQETGNLKKLAKVYAAMSPDTAASVLEQLDNQAVVKVLIFLKSEETAAILEAIAKKGEAAARRAAQISEQIRLSAHSTTAK